MWSTVLPVFIHLRVPLLTAKQGQSAEQWPEDKVLIRQVCRVTPGKMVGAEWDLTLDFLDLISKFCRPPINPFQNALIKEFLGALHF